nr:hypothetical protein Iba_chr02cCG5510 [Ipomoea batatas]
MEATVAEQQPDQTEMGRLSSVSIPAVLVGEQKPSSLITQPLRACDISITQVKTYCNDLCRDYECSSIATSSSKHVQSVVGGENLTKGDPVRNKLKTFMESATHLAETSELDLYLEAKRSPFDDDLDVLLLPQQLEA